MPAAGWVNLHFSLLPAWRGAAPVQHAVMAGDEVTGATTFRVEQGLDTGPIVRRDDRDDPAHRHRRRPAAAAVRRPAPGCSSRPWTGSRTGDLEAGAAAGRGRLARAQDHRRGRARRWERPALAVDRQIRGCTPAPGAWTTFRGERLKLLPVTAAPSTGAARRHRARSCPVGARVHVGTGHRPGRARHRAAARAASRWPRPTGPAASASMQESGSAMTDRDQPRRAATTAHRSPPRPSGPGPPTRPGWRPTR